MSSTPSPAPSASPAAEANTVESSPERQGGPSKDVPLPAPTLAAYYSERSTRLVDWIKAIKAAKLTSFAEDDLKNASEKLADWDFDLRKTLALAGVQNPPGPVRRWVKEAVQRTLDNLLPPHQSDTTEPVADQIGRIAESLSGGLTGQDKPQRARHEAVLQLALKSVLKSRSDFDAGAILGALFRPLRTSAKRDTRLAAGELRKRLLEAGVRQLRDLSLVQANAQDRIANAELARREAQERADDASMRLKMERDLVKSLKIEIAERQREVEAFSAEVGRLKTAIHDTQQIGAHGTAAVSARVRTLLANRLPPLLEDAADAISREPLYVDIALERIASVRSILKGEITWLDESSD